MPVRKVSLRADDGLYIDAVEWSSGRISIDGQDLNPPEGFGLGDDYEYSYRVPANQVPRLVAALGGAPDSDPLRLIQDHATEILECRTGDSDDPDVPSFGPSAWFECHGIGYDVTIR